MGAEQPDYTKDVYCKRCGKVTPHDFYIKKKYYQQNQITELEYVTINRTVDSGSYTKTKQVCTICGKTKEKTEKDFCCQIF